jgi:hypothetical protein
LMFQSAPDVAATLLAEIFQGCFCLPSENMWLQGDLNVNVLVIKVFNVKCTCGSRWLHIQCVTSFSTTFQQVNMFHPKWLYDVPVNVLANVLVSQMLVTVYSMSEIPPSMLSQKNSGHHEINLSFKLVV